MTALGPGLPVVLVRLHRPAPVAWAVLITLTSALMLWARGPGDDAAHAEWLRFRGDGQPCTWGAAIVDHHRARTLAETVIAVIPLPVAAWAGAALIGRELESGSAPGLDPGRPARPPARRQARAPRRGLTAGSVPLVVLHRPVTSANPFPYDWGRHSQNLPSDSALTLTSPLLGLTVGALAGLVPRRSLAAPVAAAVATEAVLTTTGYLRVHHPSPHSWPLRITETGLVLTVAAAAVVIAFRLPRRGAA